MKILLPFVISGFVALLLYQSSCIESSARPPLVDPLTRAFNSYLKNNFGDSIPGKEQYYILVSKKATRERIGIKLNRIRHAIIPAVTTAMYVSSSVSLPDSLIFCDQTITDWNTDIDRAEFIFSAVTIIHSNNCRVISKDDVMDQDENYWKEFFR